MTESIRREFIENASEIGIDLNDKMLSSFDIYYKNLLEWNAVMNLTAITEEKDVFEKHFLDSLTITKIVSRETLDKGCTLMDLGTGAGFPGLPIAIVFPNIQVVLVDSLRESDFLRTRFRNWAFLMSLVSMQGRRNFPKTKNTAKKWISAAPELWQICRHFLNTVCPL